MRLEFRPCVVISNFSSLFNVLQDDPIKLHHSCIGSGYAIDLKRKVTVTFCALVMFVFSLNSGDNSGVPEISEQ
jgi:hypothetical protein